MKILLESQDVFVSISEEIITKDIMSCNINNYNCARIIVHLFPVGHISSLHKRCLPMVTQPTLNAVNMFKRPWPFQSITIVYATDNTVYVEQSPVYIINIHWDKNLVLSSVMQCITYTAKAIEPRIKVIFLPTCGII